MATIYKKGSWAEHGRVMPGRRTKPKAIDQILQDGRVVCVGKDQIFTPSEITRLLMDCFLNAKLVNGRVCLSPIKNNGSGIYFYPRNINHLGGDWGPEKKRIQIGKDFPKIYEANKAKDIETVLLGVYHYFPDGQSGVTLFVCYSSNTFANKHSNNSAAHVHTIDLLNALKKGVYRRLDKSGNELFVLDRKNFIRHINNLRGAEGIDVVRKDKEVLNYFGEMFDCMPRRFVGIDCYKEMMAANDTTGMNQNHWEGWYFEFYVRKYLQLHPTDDIVWWSRKNRADLDFDLRFPYRKWFYGDVKSDSENGALQGNVKDNIDFLVQEKGGTLWYVALAFIPERDADHAYETTIWWNKQQNLQRKKKHDLMTCSKSMKFAINVTKMVIYQITRDTIPYLKIVFPSPVKGKPRRPKYNIPHKMKEFLRIEQFPRNSLAEVNP